MSCRIMKVTNLAVSNLLLGNPHPYKSDLPEDVQCRNIVWDKFGNYYELILESEEWDAPKEGERFPEIFPLFTVLQEPNSADSASPSSVPVAGDEVKQGG